jgi:HEAT repeat protein
MKVMDWLGVVVFVVVLSGCSQPVPPDAPKSRAQREPDRLVVPVTALQPIVPSAPPDSRANADEPAVTVKPFAEWTEQEVAADTLARIGPSAVPTLLETLRQQDPAMRLRAVEVLGRMGADAKAAVPALIPLLDDPDPRVRKATARTLGRIGPEAADAIPALMRSLLTPTEK